MDQCGCLQSVTGTLAAHVVMGEAVQLVIDKRRQSCQCRLVAVTPRHQKLRDFLWGIFLHCRSSELLAQKRLLLPAFW